MRIVRGLGASALVLFSLGACNQLFGIEDANRLGADASDDGAASIDGEILDGQPSVDGAPVVGLGPPPYALTRAGTGFLGETIMVTRITRAGGRLTAWTRDGAPGESPELGTNMVLDLGADEGSPVNWGRWAGGNTGGTASSSVQAVAIQPTAGLHYALGRASPGPTVVRAPGSSGKVDYDLVGTTRATTGSGIGVPGYVRGKASIMPGTNRVGLSLIVESDGDYPVETEGGSDDPTKSIVFYGPPRVYTSVYDGLRVTPSGPGTRACTETARPCHAEVNGFITGSNHERMAIMIEIYGGASETYRLTVLAIFARR
jgi:hypothetical protein